MYILIALTSYGNGYLSCSCYMLASNHQLSSYLHISCPTITLCILVVMLQTHHVQSELLWSWPPWILRKILGVLSHKNISHHSIFTKRLCNYLIHFNWFYFWKLHCLFPCKHGHAGWIPLQATFPLPLVVISQSTDRAALSHTGWALDQTPIRTSGSVMRSNPLGSSSSK